MRTRIPIFLIAVFLLGPTPAIAQLSPEILTDSYLLRAEQAIRDGDKDRARAEIDKIILLQKEHELDLSEEFHFRYAKTAAAAALPEQALEAVVKYLTAAGRDSQHYIEALELMNKAQDAIEGRKDSQVALRPENLCLSSQPRKLETITAPCLHRRARRRRGARCGTRKSFFETATVEEVTACLDAGADPKARDKYKWTPLHLAAGYNKNPAVIQALINAGADPKAQNSLKWTPLHWAAGSNENPDVTKILIAAGADLEVRGKIWK